MIVESTQVLPAEPATDAQLSYARDLGIAIPDHATKDELRDLLSCHLDRDKPATERHRGFAKLYAVEHTRFVGKRALFNTIFAALQAPGRESQLVAWFTYRVYRELVHGAEHAAIEGPEDPTIQAMASELIADESVLRSIRRYTGSDLIWFGEWTAPNGRVHNGGSNRTIAYKRASQLLRDRLTLHKGLPESHREVSPRVPKDTVRRGQRDYRYLILLLILGLLLIVLLVAVYGS